MKTYSDKLKDPRWQKKRLEIMSLKNFTCECCGSSENELHVHHRFYIKEREVWEYDNDVFQLLCVNCHKKAHEEKLNTIEVIPKKYETIIGLIDKCEKIDGNIMIFLESILTRYLEEVVDGDFICNLSSAFESYHIRGVEWVLNVMSDIERIEIGYGTEINVLKKIVENIKR